MNSKTSFLQFGAPRDQAELTILLMHGLGASGDDFADVAHHLAESAQPDLWRFVLPNAPEMPVTVNGGMTMPAWYDILDMAHPRSVDWSTVASSSQKMEALIEAEQPKKLVLAGFSQGGAMALHMGLRMQKQIAGIVAMSGYLLEAEDHPCPKCEQTDLPLAVFHGEWDDVIPQEIAKQSIESLEKNGFTVESQFYPRLGHTVAEDEIGHLFQFLKKLGN